MEHYWPVWRDPFFQACLGVKACTEQARSHKVGDFIELEENQKKTSAGKALTNHDIDEYFDKKVCYPRDSLGKVRGQEFLVINNDESDGPGKHWVAMVNRNDRIYFDSFGVRPQKEVEDLVQKDLYYHTYRLQAFDSNKCGYFCIDFINNVRDFKSFHDWLMKFNVIDFEKNDEVVMQNLNQIK